MKSLVSPKELANAIGVSESSVKRWADEGMVKASRTVGGHRRIALAEAIRFIRQIRATVVRPEILGLSEMASSAEKVNPDRQNGESLFAALERGDATLCRGMIQAMYVSGQSVAQICDGPVREAMVRMGELWLHQEWGIAVEHRATDICIQAVNQLRFLQVPPPDDAPIAVGCAADDDPYMLPSLMCAAVVAEAGFRDVNLGPRTPIRILHNAVEHYQAALVWVTVSWSTELARITSEISSLARELRKRSIPMVVGGRQLASASPSDLAGVTLAHSMTQFDLFARGVISSRQTGGASGSASASANA